MKITIDVRWPRWLQARRRRTKVLITGLVAAGIVAVPVAWASHDFTDVPTGHPFHADIGAVKDAGITAGKTCVPPGTPPTYCPSEPITREAMAAFMRRGAGRIASEEVLTSATVNSTEGNKNISDVDITVGGVSGLQLVHVQATITAFATNVACPCNFGIRLWDGPVGGTLIQETFDQFTVAGVNQRTFTISDVVLASSGSHEYFLSIATNSAVDVNLTDLNMTATNIPFGWNGTAVLDGAPPETPRATVTP